jgi:hypothetical protein
MEVVSFPICSQCGYSHPRIAEGKKCPMAKVKTESGKDINFGEFFANLKNILTSQIEKKKIEDTQKLFGKIIVEVTKITEEY